MSTTSVNHGSDWDVVKEEGGRTEVSPPQQRRFRFLIWMSFVTFANFGCQFVGSVQFAVGTPLFNDQLKVAASTVSIILATAGPISGLVVQPLVGVYSDTYESRFGRRRPYMVVGVLGTALGMGLIGFSVKIGNALGDAAQGTTAGSHVRALSVAITGLWVMNVFNNVLQSPARSIVADVVPPAYQQDGNAMVSNLMGGGAILANVVGAQFFGTSEPYLYLFSIGMAVLILSMIPTLVAAKEVPYVREPGESKPTVAQVFAKIWRGFRYMPPDMVRISFVYFLAWCGYSPFLIYLTQFFGNNVYGGDPDVNPDVYNHGVKMGMYALACFATVAFVFALMMPMILRRVGIRLTFFVTQLSAAACYLLFLWVRKPLPCFVITAVTGLSFTAFNSIPFGLVTLAVEPASVGMFMGVMNCLCVLAQSLVNLSAGQIVRVKDENVAWGIAFGGCFSVVAAASVWLLRTEKAERLADAVDTDPEVDPLLLGTSEMSGDDD